MKLREEFVYNSNIQVQQKYLGDEQSCESKFEGKGGSTFPAPSTDYETRHANLSKSNLKLNFQILPCFGNQIPLVNCSFPGRVIHI